MNTGYRGVHLESNFIRNYNPVGVLGTSVYQTAVVLREILLRHDKSSGQNLALHLAIPQSNQSDTEVDWYADPALTSDQNTEKTSVINWNQATLEERKIAFEKIKAFKNSIEVLSTKLNSKTQDTTSDQYIFSQLLPKVLYTPSLPAVLNHTDSSAAQETTHIFLVGPDQFPVLTFWGFTHPQAPAYTDPLGYIAQSLVSPVAPALAPVPPIAPVAAPPIVHTHEETVVRRVRPWWYWLLPLLLLLLLLWLWRSCSTPSLPTLPHASLPALSAPSVTPSKSLFGFDVPNWMPDWLPGIKTIALPALGAGAAPSAATAPLAATTPPRSTAAQAPSAPANAALPASPAPATPATAVPPPINLDSPAVAPVTPDLTPPAIPAVPSPPAVNFGPELSIPPSVAGDNNTRYLDGNWQVSAIQDQNTGRSVRLRYAINNGEGTVQVEQSNGTHCMGTVQAMGQATGLALNSTSQAACSDGGSYEIPKIECKLNANQETECFGRYDNQLFPISMRQANQ